MDQPIWMGKQRAWIHCDKNVESGFFHTYDELLLDEFDSHKVHIFLPIDYETSGQRYSVIYMNDGHCVFFSESLNGGSWRVHYTLDELWKQNQIQKLIVVAVVPKDRNREYTHVYWAFDGYNVVWDALPGSSSGGLPFYSKYMCKLKEFVDINYRTNPAANVTSIVGASHGGLASFYIALAHSSHFGIAGCLSSSFGAGLDFGGSGGSLNDAPLIQDFISNLLSKERPRFWIAWGLKRDGGNHNLIVEQVATDRSKELVWLLCNAYHYWLGVDVYQFEDSLRGHEEQAWEHQFKIFVQTFYK